MPGSGPCLALQEYTCKKIRDFMYSHTAYELIPESGKVVLLDVDLPVRQVRGAQQRGAQGPGCCGPACASCSCQRGRRQWRTDHSCGFSFPWSRCAQLVACSFLPCAAMCCHVLISVAGWPSTCSTEADGQHGAPLTRLLNAHTWPGRFSMHRLQPHCTRRSAHVRYIRKWPLAGRETWYLQVLRTYNLQSCLHATGSTPVCSGVSPGFALLNRDRKVYLHSKLVAHASKQ